MWGETGFWTRGFTAPGSGSCWVIASRLSAYSSSIATVETLGGANEATIQAGFYMDIYDSTSGEYVLGSPAYQGDFGPATVSGLFYVPYSSLSQWNTFNETVSLTGGHSYAVDTYLYTYCLTGALGASTAYCANDWGGGTDPNYQAILSSVTWDENA